MTPKAPGMGGFAPRELILAAAARIVLAACRKPAQEKNLTPAASASLHVLEAALDPYPAGRLDERDK